MMGAQRVIFLMDKSARKQRAPGTWNVLLMAGGKSGAVVKCPACGGFSTLENHTINDVGEVSPSLVCPYPHCNYHQFITLGGWEG